MGKLNRNTKISLAVLFLVPIIISTIGLSILGAMDKKVYLKSLYAQGEIVILNDNDFSVRYSLPGSGIAEDPFLIENYIFDNPDTTAIVIKDTTKHFVIRNCSVKKHGQPIFISNIGYNTGAVINSTFFEDFTLDKEVKFKDSRENDNWFIHNCVLPDENGFTFFINAPGIRIENNLFRCSSEGIGYETYGLSIHSSDYSVVNNNTLSFFYRGLNLVDSLYLTVVNNFCYNNSYGLHFYEIDDSLVMNNICTKNVGGIGAVHIERVLFIANNLSYNSEFGFQVHMRVTSCQIRGNLIEGNRHGLIGTIYYSNITYNYFNLNSNYAIRIEYVSGNYIYHNSFINNNDEGLSLSEKQAFDNTYENEYHNYWYDVNSKEGNYWSNLIWNEDSEYPIDGGNSIDQYPLFEPPIIGFWEVLHCTIGL